MSRCTHCPNDRASMQPRSHNCVAPSFARDSARSQPSSRR
jgi:hypothetical protein